MKTLFQNFEKGFSFEFLFSFRILSRIFPNFHFMHLLQKIISSFLLAIFLGSSFSPAFALTNKETTISFVDSLRTSISAGIASREKTLSDRANEL